METAERLWKALMGFVAMNMAFDKKNGDPDEVVMKQRAATTGFIRIGVIASDFITESGLTKEYRAFEKKVNKEVAKIVARSKK